MRNTKKEVRTHFHSGFVRIIGGKWKGRKLEVIEKPGLRPTGDRMKETLFNWLMHDIIGSHCLDLFAGSGSLGFESASRGAASVTLIEKDKAVTEILTNNIKKLACDTIIALQIDALEYIKVAPKKAFDIIFLDPPFNQGLLGRLLFDLLQQGFLEKNGIIYLESEYTSIIEIPDSLNLIKEKISGQVRYQLLQYDPID
ncbi:16S rRNA (guanine(966)-N(2))-methyltransferase RsmD [Thorsellia kenyensis]|uniref:Ribosomal RNA small subunit methyltransferase D n=1 Tax=Thorsellia kenyensis TaxID=1549888 RepID=A0ABV6CAT5_9GAMM